MALPNIIMEVKLVYDQFMRGKRQVDKAIDDLSKNYSKSAKEIKESGTRVSAVWDHSVKKANTATDMIGRLWTELKKKLDLKDVAIDWRDFMASSEQIEGVFGKQARVLPDLIHLFNRLGAANVGVFDSVVKVGLGYTNAMRAASVAAQVQLGASGALDKVALGLANNLGKVTLALTAIGIAAGVTIKFIKDSIASFSEYAEQIYRLNVVVGGSVQTTSEYVQVARMLNVSTTDLITSIGMMEKKISDLTLREADLSEESHEVQRALDAFGIEVRDQSGALRSYDDILVDIIKRTEEWGLSTETTGMLQNIMGRSAKELMPLLALGADRFKELTEWASRNATVSEHNIAVWLDYQLATSKADLAMQAFRDTIAEGILPTLTDLVTAIADVITALRKQVANVIALDMMLDMFICAWDAYGDVTLAAQMALEEFNVTFSHYMGQLSKAEEAERAATEAMQKRERAIGMAQYAMSRLTDELLDLQEQYIDRRLDAERQFAQRWEDIILQRARDIEDAERRLAQRLEDIWLQYYRRLEDLEESFAQQDEDRERRNARRLAELDEQGYEQREDLLKDHMQRLEDIREQFNERMREAARARDAVAFLKAMRDRDTAISKEKKQYKQRVEDLDEQLDRRREKLLESFKEEEEDAKRNQQRQRDAARKALDQQLEDLERSLEREREEREISYRRQEEDLERARQRQLESIERWYVKEEFEHKKALDAQLDILEQHGEDTVSEVEGLYDKLLQKRKDYYAELRTIDQQAGTLLGTWPTGGAGQGTGGLYLPNIIRRRAEGGVDVVNRPTHYLAGERGPEIAAFIPIRSTVHHTFGQLRGSFSGVTTSSEQQVMALITEALYAWARRNHE